MLNGQICFVTVEKCNISCKSRKSYTIALAKHSHLLDTYSRVRISTWHIYPSTHPKGIVVHPQNGIQVFIEYCSCLFSHHGMHNYYYFKNNWPVERNFIHVINHKIHQKTLFPPTAVFRRGCVIFFDYFATSNLFNLKSRSLLSDN